MLGENSLEVATTWLNLGGVLRAAGKLEEAESACRQCLDIRERQLGSQHTDTAAAQIGGHATWQLHDLVQMGTDRCKEIPYMMQCASD